MNSNPKHPNSLLPGVHFEPAGVRVKPLKDQAVLDVALAAKISIAHSCGGMGSCGTCLLRVRSNLSDLPPRNELESEMAHDRGFSPDERLACQLEAFDGLEVLVVNSDELD
jgi:2Fe-2S ferredoxin